MNLNDMGSRISVLVFRSLGVKEGLELGFRIYEDVLLGLQEEGTIDGFRV